MMLTCISSSLTVRLQNTRDLWSARRGTLGCDAGYTCGPNNISWPLLERVYHSRNSMLKGCIVENMPLGIPSYSLEDLLDISDESLFRSIRYEEHVE